MEARPAATPAPPTGGRAAQGHTRYRGLVSSSPVFGLKYEGTQGKELVENGTSALKPTSTWEPEPLRSGKTRGRWNAEKEGGSEAA